MNILPAGIKFYSRERILLAGTKYNSRGTNITRGDHILLAGMKYYSRECINYSRGRKITCGNEILLAGIQYYSRKWIITRGKKYYSRERIVTGGNLFITRGNDILLAGEKYWQYMAPEGFRRIDLWKMRFLHISKCHLFSKRPINLISLSPPGRHWLRWLQLPCPNYAARLKRWQGRFVYCRFSHNTVRI